ncbi:uncharacterized protein LOC133188144 [Saccostrea echinata]|uniref:uncharacterized protein LOC133188144 n=1 Tax=Saccostrea echinata TaxID=191078 RepID=UPI002A80EA68|nr:uncharacterized protein LOC133188144 [Saccostrea echinata]
MSFRVYLVVLLVFVIDTTRGSSRYRIVDFNRPISWNQARDECRRTRGWDLVKIENRNEDQALKTFLAGECNSGGDGWFIGGQSENGAWTWADGSEMIYNNFPIERTSSIGIPQTVVRNFAVIFKSDLQWGYVAPRPTPRMGYICERTTC